MKIGIDIDDTIADTWEYMKVPHSEAFNIPIEKMEKLLPYYNVAKDKVSLDVYFDTMRPYYAKMTIDIPIKEEAKEIINKLYDEGHTIYFITARGKVHQDAYNDTIEYLAKHKIKYHKLITNIWNKGDICKQEKIDLLIDDSIRHCESTMKNGIDVLMYDTVYNQHAKQFKHVKNWQEIYDYIQSR